MSALDFVGGTKTPLFLQAEVGECGLACVGMVAAFHGFKSDLATLRRQFPQSLKGADFQTLSRLSDELDVSSRGLQLELNEIRHLRMPAILHWNLNHFVVVTKCKGDWVWINDPALGTRRMTLAEVSNHFTGMALELLPNADFEPVELTQRIKLSEFWRLMTGLRKGLVHLVILSLVLQALALTSPFYMQLVVDEVVVNQDFDLLVLLAAGFGGLAAFGIAVRAMRSWISLYIGTQLSFQLGSNLFRHLAFLPLPFFWHRHMGDIVSRFASLKPIMNLITTGVVAVMIDGLLAVTTLIMLMIYNSLLAWIVIASLILYALLRAVYFQPFRSLEEEMLVTDAKQESVFMESIRAMQTIKLYGKELDRINLWQNAFADSMNVRIRTGKMAILFESSLGVLGLIENTMVIYIGATMVVSGSFSIGMLYAFLAYKASFSSAVTNLIDQAVILKMVNLHLERVSDIALETTEKDEPIRTSDAESNSTLIELENVSYRYGEGESLVVDNISLRLRSGEHLAIVGPSGCGKSTLLRIMLGLIVPTSGVVLVGTEPISRYGLLRHRGNIGSVMQDDRLLAGSVFDNICMFDEKPNVHRIEHVAKLAEIHETILAMPMGYNSIIGEHGSGFSGGQEQRIFLARALYKNPRVLLMDEGTSHLDPETEMRVMKNIRSLDVACAFITHNEKLLQYADRVIAA